MVTRGNKVFSVAPPLSEAAIFGILRYLFICLFAHFFIYFLFVFLFFSIRLLGYLFVCLLIRFSFVYLHILQTFVRIVYNALKNDQVVRGVFENLASYLTPVKKIAGKS